MAFVTGSNYEGFSEANQLQWLRGAIDGIIAESVAQLADTPTRSSNVSWLSQCLVGVDLVQVRGIFEKELADNPEVWHLPAAFILRKRIHGFCASRGNT